MTSFCFDSILMVLGKMSYGYQLLESDGTDEIIQDTFVFGGEPKAFWEIFAWRSDDSFQFPSHIEYHRPFGNLFLFHCFIAF